MNKSIGLALQIVTVAGALSAPSLALARNALEQVVDALPQQSKVLLVSQGLYYEHPQCPDPIEGDSRSLASDLVKRLEKHHKEARNRNKSIGFDAWDGAESDLRQEERDEISQYAREHHFTHVLYFQATKRYRWNANRQAYTLTATDWTFRLNELGRDETQFIQGAVNSVADWFDNSEAIPVACPGRG